MKTYKISCEFFIKADDKDNAFDIVVDDLSDGGFFERHITIEESALPKDEEHFNE